MSDSAFDPSAPGARSRSAFWKINRLLLIMVSSMVIMSPVGSKQSTGRPFRLSPWTSNTLLKTLPKSPVGTEPTEVMIIHIFVAVALDDCQQAAVVDEERPGRSRVPSRAGGDVDESPAPLPWNTMMLPVTTVVLSTVVVSPPPSPCVITRLLKTLMAVEL